MMACSHSYKKTVSFVDRDRFMGTWYVQAGRFTMLETDVHNGVEVYKWNQKENRIDVDFKYNKGSFEGPVKSLPQKAWIINTKTNAHWKVSPFWPLKFNYFVIGLGENYEWTAIGVPDQNYLWIMTREKNVSREQIKSYLKTVAETEYSIKDIVYVPHSK